MDAGDAVQARTNGRTIGRTNDRTIGAILLEFRAPALDHRTKQSYNVVQCCRTMIVQPCTMIFF